MTHLSQCLLKWKKKYKKINKKRETMIEKWKNECMDKK